MALTSQIQESYLRVQEKASILQSKASQFPDEYSSVKTLINLINERLTDGTPAGQETLRDKVKLVDVSVTVLHRLKESMISNLPAFAELDHDIGELQTENQKLEGLLSGAPRSQTVADKKVDLNSPDDCLLQLITDPSSRRATRRLLREPTFRLEKNQIEPLTTVWSTAMQGFIEDAQQLSNTDGRILPGQPATLATFFCVRNQLVTLYNRLALSVA